MISPFTGGKVVLRQELREIIFRNEKFSYMAQFYVCVDTQEQFTTTELDEINMEQVYAQYCAKHGLKTINEIRDWCARFAKSSTRNSQIKEGIWS